MNEREAYIALNMMTAVGRPGIRTLISSIGSALALFEAGVDDLMKCGMSRENANAFALQRPTIDIDAEMARATDSNARIIAVSEREYPAALKEIHDPPLALYVQGNFEVRDSHAMAIVGTRRPTRYGQEMAENFSGGLAAAGYTVVSGLATGIDTCAHNGALSAKGRTIAVIGGGLDHITPVANKVLAANIAEQGCVISEYPFGKNPDRTTFPRRNRIVSGLAMGVIVIEAGLRSGSLITANLALSEGRIVFAMPGRIDSPMSKGTNNLIKNGACLVGNVDDVLGEFEFLIRDVSRPKAVITRALPRLSKEESAVVDLLEEGELDVDSLIRASGIKPSGVSSLLVGLEMKKVVRMLPGRIVELIRK